jgi:hypothetical protein
VGEKLYIRVRERLGHFIAVSLLRLLFLVPNTVVFWLINFWWFLSFFLGILSAIICHSHGVTAECTISISDRRLDCRSDGERIAVDEFNEFFFFRSFYSAIQPRVFGLGFVYL